MEAESVSGIINDTEDSDVSLLIVNDNDETVDDTSDVDANMRIPDTILSDGTPSNPTLEMGTEVACPVSAAAASSLPLSADSSAATSGNATQDSVVVTGNDSSCQRNHRRSHRHRRSGSGRRRHRLCRFKRKESNYMSATCHVIVIVLVCVALAGNRWFYVHGGRCSDARQSPVHYLGIKTFFYEGPRHGVFVNHDAYFYGSSLHDVLLDCVTSEAVLVMRVIIAICIFIMFISIVACLMDVFGPTHVVCRAIRFTASLSILSACACVVIVGLCYLVSQQLSNYYTETQLDHSKVLVEFNAGFYIITSAGAVSIVGVAFTLLRRVRGSTSRRRFLSTDRRHVDANVDRLADASRPSAGRTPPPYRR